MDLVTIKWCSCPHMSKKYLSSDMNAFLCSATSESISRICGTNFISQEFFSCNGHIKQLVNCLQRADILWQCSLCLHSSWTRTVSSWKSRYTAFSMYSRLISQCAVIRSLWSWTRAVSCGNWACAAFSMHSRLISSVLLFAAYDHEQT